MCSDHIAQECGIMCVLTYTESCVTHMELCTIYRPTLCEIGYTKKQDDFWKRDPLFIAEVTLQSYDTRGKTKRYWIAPKEEDITVTKTILPLRQK